MDTYTFANHPPVRFAPGAKMWAAQRDGGSYQGIGYNTYYVLRGKMLHLIHNFNSGCDYGGGTHTERTHIGTFADAAALAKFLRETRTDEDGNFPWWASELLEQMGEALPDVIAEG